MSRESGPGCQPPANVLGPIRWLAGRDPRRYHVTVVSQQVGEWVLLSYRMPREPSTPRIAVWRRLKTLGVAQLSDGLVALPHDSRTREQLEWAADQVLEGGGTATIWIGSPASSAEERAIAAVMSAEIAGQYAAVTQEARAAEDLPEPRRRRRLARLHRELRRIHRRDYFPPPERQVALEAVERLAAVAERV